MTRSIIHSAASSNSRRIVAAFLLSALFVGGKAQAQNFDVYVAQSTGIGGTLNIVDYSFSTVTGSTTQVASYTPTSTFTGASNVDVSSLQLSGDGTALTTIGFSSSSVGTSSAVIFNLASKTFDTTTSFGGTGRSAYLATGSGTTVYIGGGSNSPGVRTRGTNTTSLPTLMNSSGTSTSINNFVYNSASNLMYYTPNANGSSANGIWVASTPGVLTSASAFTQIAGSGSTNFADVGLGFLGANTIFAANGASAAASAGSPGKIQVFTNTAGTWSLSSLTLNLSDYSAILGSALTPLQLSVVAVDPNNAIVFFTATSLAGGSAALTGTSTNTFGEVSFNTTSGFSNLNVLGTSTSDFYSGIVGIESVPEPSSYALLGLGLVLIAWTSIRRKAGPKRA